MFCALHEGLHPLLSAIHVSDMSVRLPRACGSVKRLRSRARDGGAKL